MKLAGPAQRLITPPTAACYGGVVATSSLTNRTRQWPDNGCYRCPPLGQAPAHVQPLYHVCQTKRVTSPVLLRAQVATLLVGGTMAMKGQINAQQLTSFVMVRNPRTTISTLTILLLTIKGVIQ